MSAEDIRQRKVGQSDDEDRSAATGRRKSGGSGGATNSGGPSGLKFSFLCLTVCVVILLLILGVYTDSMSPFVEHIVYKLGYQKAQYAVIIDAGSTGSRVLAYKFHKQLLDNRLILDEELFKERKPGLSSFAEDPLQGARSIKLLLDEAKHFIPQDDWANSPLVLKATAGLRLLPVEKADNLLNSVRDLFIKSEFFIDENAVEIMDGTDEGIFSWFTVNLLLGRLSKRNQAAALDLGGGSTQVTFSPSDSEPLQMYEKYIRPVQILDKEIKLFTNSYLGLGLMAVRHAVFTKNELKAQVIVESECVNPIIRNKTWTYSNVEYYISGKDNGKSTSENPVVDFDDCLNNIKKIVVPLVKPKPLSLKQHTIAAFSYYFERAIETGLVDPFKGGEITVDDYRKMARQVCATANTDQPFMCLDMSFISILLKDGFGLNEKKKIKLYKKIDGHEISWALGCAYHVLMNNERFNS